MPRRHASRPLATSGPRKDPKGRLIWGRMKPLAPVLFLVLLPMASQNPVHSAQSLLEVLEKDLASLLLAAEGDPTLLPHGSLPQVPNGQHPPRDAPSQPPGDAWIRFLNDLVHSQKKFRGRNKKVAQQGCFGIKLDRIGTLSGLGC